MTSDSIKPVEQRYNYSNALTGLVNLVKDEGLKGLTRGLGANTVRLLQLFSRCTLKRSEDTSRSHERKSMRGYRPHAHR